MSVQPRILASWGLAALLAVALLSGQALADSMLPPDAHGDTARVMGRSGFAYLTGIRTYVAAVLWARLDPLDDGYYEDVAFSEKKFLLPSIRLVTWLDPDFEEPFYAGPFILFEAGRKREAVQLAEDGVRANPDSALLHASFAQLLLAEGRLSEARREADLTLTSTWQSEGDAYQLLSGLEVIFRKTGAGDKAEWAASERARLKAKFGLEAPSHEAGD